MNRNASQTNRQSECESVGRSGNSLELEAGAIRIHPQVPLHSRPPDLCADQEVEVQAEVQSLPSPRTLILSEQLLAVKAELTIG